MSRSHIAYGPKDAIGKIIAGRHIPTNCLVITKVDDPAEEAELLFFDKDYTPHQVSMRHVFTSMEVATEWVGRYYCVGRYIVVKDDNEEWHSYIVGDDNSLILSDGSDKVSIVTAGDASVVINGETITPTIAVNLDPEYANGLVISDDGLALNVASDTRAGAMSALDKFKLDEIEAGAQVNTITDISTGRADGTISVNGVDVPVKGLGSAAFTSSGDYTPAGVGMVYTVVDELPAEGEPNVVYLVLNEGEEDNIYDEFLFVDGEPELIGTTATDLSDYYTKEEAEQKIRAEIDDAITGKADMISLSKVAITGSYNDLSDKPAFPLVLGVTKRNDGYYYPDITYSQGISYLEAGGQLSVHWPEDNLVYQCKLWRSTSSSIFFGVQDDLVYRTLRWNSLSGRVEAFSTSVFVASSDLSNKVDKITGKGLSTNDFTDAEKSKLAGFGDASLYALKSDIQWIYKYKGSVADASALPNSGNNIVGDVYNVEDTGMNYAWNGTEWDALGAISAQPTEVESISNSDVDSILEP